MDDVTTHAGKRNVGLDLMRATAIGLVILGHITVLLGPQLNGLLQINGYLGVEIFFALSGFLIGGILIRTVGPAPGVGTTLSFWIRRWMRTIPAYWVVAIVLLVVEPWNPKHLYYFLFLQNIAAPELFGTFFGVSWSLAIEEWFYLLVPIVLTAGLLAFPQRRRTVFVVACCLMILGPLALRIRLAALGEVPWWTMRQAILPRLDAIGFGVAMAVIREFHRELYARIQRTAGAIVVAAVLSAVMMAWAILNVDVLKTTFMKTMGFSLVPLVCALLLPAIESIDAARLPARLVRVLTFVSVTSYSVYLTHWEIIKVVQRYNVHWQLGPNVLAVLICLPLVFAVAFVLHAGIEKPFMALRDRLTAPERRALRTDPRVAPV